LVVIQNVNLIAIYHYVPLKSKISHKLDRSSSQVYASACTLGIGPQVSFWWEVGCSPEPIWM